VKIDQGGTLTTGADNTQVNFYGSIVGGNAGGTSLVKTGAALWVVGQNNVNLPLGNFAGNTEIANGIIYSNPDNQWSFPLSLNSTMVLDLAGTFSTGNSNNVGLGSLVGPGTVVTIGNGEGGEAVGEIVETGPGGIVVKVRERRPRGAAEWRLTLVRAVPKGERMEWIVQKAVELGAWSVVPVMTERGVVRLEGERAANRVTRWQRIAVEAAKQCRTAWVMRVEPVATLSQWLGAAGRPGELVVGSLEDDARPFRDVCAGLRQQPSRSVAMLIGPEGDFTPTELAAAKAAGARPVTFGRRVLRVETAAIYALSVLAHELGVMAAE